MTRPSAPRPLSLLAILWLTILPSVGFAAPDQAEQRPPRDPGPTMLALAPPSASMSVVQPRGEPRGDAPDARRPTENTALDLKLMIHRVTVGQ